MKKHLLLFLAVLFAAPLANAVSIGEKVKLPAYEVWYGSKKAPLKKWSRKYIAIVFITTKIPDAFTLKKLESVKEAVARQNMEVFCVANGISKDTKEVKNWKDFSIPVAFDLRSELFSAVSRGKDRVLFAAVLTPAGELAWRGPFTQLPALANEIKSGKYTIADAARREKFTESFTALLKDKKYQDAVSLISAEQKHDPGNVELLHLKTRILAQKLEKLSEALAEVDKVIAVNPRDVRLYSLKLILLRKDDPKKEGLEVFRQAAKNLAGNPAALQAMVQQEMARNTNCCIEGVYLLSKAAVSAKKYASKKEQGISLLSHARILHYCGKTAAAAKMADAAAKMLAGKEKAAASALAEHLNKVAALSAAINE